MVEVMQRAAPRADAAGGAHAPPVPTVRRLDPGAAEVPSGWMTGRFKRAVDVIGAAFGLIVFSPLFLLLAVAIRLENAGPVFYRQVRVGRSGRALWILKFRTIRQGAGGDGIFGSAGPGPAQVPLTRLGRWLRRSKLDELPQLIQVLEGEMSLVGPRPEVPRWVTRYTPAQRRVLLVRPGITDPASLRFRFEEEILARAADAEREYREKILPAKIDMSWTYARHATLAQDLRILARTLAGFAARRRR